MPVIPITIDTREQTPWHFPPDRAEVSRGTLKTGDYAITGDDLFCVERKSLSDYVGTISTGWDRFLREIERMHSPRNVIVEGSMDDIRKQKYNHPKIKPAFVFMRTAELTMLHTSVIFAENPVMAAGFAYRLLSIRHRFIQWQQQK